MKEVSEGRHGYVKGRKMQVPPDWHARIRELSTDEMQARVAELDSILSGRCSSPTAVEKPTHVRQTKSRPSLPPGGNKTGGLVATTADFDLKLERPGHTTRKRSNEVPHNQVPAEDLDVLLGHLPSQLDKPHRPRGKKNLSSNATTETAATTTVSNRSPQPPFARCSTDSKIQSSRRRSLHRQQDTTALTNEYHHLFTANELSALKVTPLLEKYKVELKKYEDSRKAVDKPLAMQSKPASHG